MADLFWAVSESGSEEFTTWVEAERKRLDPGYNAELGVPDIAETPTGASEGEKPKGGSEEPPLVSAESSYFPAGFTLDLMEIDPNASRPSTSAIPRRRMPPVFVTATRPKSATDTVLAPIVWVVSSTDSALVSPFGG